LNQYKKLILLMYLLLSKFCILEFQLLLGGVAPYIEFVTINCLIAHPLYSNPIVFKVFPSYPSNVYALTLSIFSLTCFCAIYCLIYLVKWFLVHCGLGAKCQITKDFIPPASILGLLVHKCHDCSFNCLNC